jgi:ankyrin repeat protein
MKDLTTELLYAAGRGDLTSVRELIAKGVSVNAANHVGGTALMSACASYRSEIVEFLLQAGADVNFRTNDGRTALHTAVGSSPSLPEKQKDCVRLLLNHSVQIDAQDNSGLTPLMNAAWFGCLLSALELLKAGASLKLKDSKGRTAKDFASLKKRDGILEAITEYER